MKSIVFQISFQHKKSSRALILFFRLYGGVYSSGALIFLFQKFVYQQIRNLLKLNCFKGLIFQKRMNKRKIGKIQLTISIILFLIAFFLILRHNFKRPFLEGGAYSRIYGIEKCVHFVLFIQYLRL